MDRVDSQANGNDTEDAAKEAEQGQSEVEHPRDAEAQEASQTETAEKGKPAEELPLHKTTSNASAKSEQQTARLHVGRLTRNVTEEHLRLIFSVWGAIKNVEVAIDRAVQLPKGYAYVEFEKREDAENALDHMHGGQIDGNIVEVTFVQEVRKKEPSPIPVPNQRPEPIPTHRSDPRGRNFEGERRRSPLRYRRRSPMRRHSRSPPRRRSPYRHRSRTPPPRRNHNGGYAYENRGPSPRRRRSPYRGRRRSPSPRYRRREPPRSPPVKRTRRSSSSMSSSISKSSSMSSSGTTSASSAS